VIRRGFDDLLQDTRYALRWCARDRGFAAIVIATLALGIGVNTAIFSVVHAVLIDPLPFEDADRLVNVRENVPAAQSPSGRPRQMDGIDTREFLELQAKSRTLTHVVTFGLALVSVQGSADAVRQELTSVSAAAFPMLRVQPVLGRWFLPDDETPGRDRVIILSYGAWQRYFGGDSQPLGKTLTFSGNVFSGNIALGEPYIVVGVMPPAFHFPDDGTQAWVPYRVTPPADGRPRRTGVMARLADGVSPATAAAEVTAIAQSIRGRSTTATPQTPAEPPVFELVRAQDQVGATVKPALTVLTAAVGVVLLIACANVANLLLARTTAREREIAVRLAIGAGRGRLIRQLLTEATLLSAAGGAVGTLLAFGGVRLFRGLATDLARIDLGSLGNAFPRLDAIGLNPSVFVFALVISIGTGVLFGLAPALRSSRVAVRVDALRGAAGSTRASAGGRSSFTAQGLLVIAEIAMTTSLVVGGALLVRSLANLTNVDRGYDATNVLTFQVSLPGDERAVPDRVARAEDLVARLRLLSGVRAAAYANQVPLVALENSLRISAAGPAPPTQPPGPSPLSADVRLVSHDYLRVMGIRVIVGRAFREDDIEGRPRALLINQTLARRDFASGHPIGTMVYVGRDTVPWEIVGVVADVRQARLDREPRPQFFVTFRQWRGPGVPVMPVGAYYALRTSSDPAALVEDVRRVVREIDARAALENIATMDQVVSNWMTRPRMYAVLLGLFAALAIALAAAGVYGVMAYTVTRRTREIGIRMALGAQRPAVLRLVLRQSLVLVAVGLMLGLVGAAGTTRYLEGLLFGLTPLDASTFAGAAMLFGVVAAVASYVPARRATAVDPLVALRCE
jgi:putative ABC transport system permease protein